MVGATLGSFLLHVSPLKRLPQAFFAAFSLPLGDSLLSHFCASSAIAAPSSTDQLYIPSLQSHCRYSPGGSSLILHFHHTHPNITLQGEDSLATYSLFSHAWSSKVIEHRLSPDLLSLKNQCLILSGLLPIDPPRVFSTYRIRAIHLP